MPTTAIDSRLAPTHGLRLAIPATPITSHTDASTHALRILRDFLASIDSNAAAGNYHSATESLSRLGEPPSRHDDDDDDNSDSIRHPSHTLDEIVLKLRSARLAREHRREQQLQPSSPIQSLTPPNSPSTKTANPDHIPPVFQVSPKRPRNLRESAILRVWDQSRLQRWWQWHDTQMARLKEVELQKQRRRQFLTNLRTHPWMEKDQQPVEQQQKVEEIHARKARAMLLSKLRTSPSQIRPSASSSPSLPLLSTEPTSPTPSEESLIQRRDSIRQLLSPRTPTSPSSPNPLKSPFSHSKQPTPELHRARLVGSHAGQLRSPVSSSQDDFWTRWAAAESLAESRDRIRNEMDHLLTTRCRQAKMARIMAKRYWIEEDLAH
ncbi:hypothetical protein DFS34DRAFT_628229 [Phlyctochytrium arcticum]|nr:hypothetical protein DFS34DRAFT_628229 [Phlyctochytrium arcticum]